MAEKTSVKPLDKGLVIEWAKGVVKVLAASDKTEAKALLAQAGKGYKNDFVRILREDTKKLYDLDLNSALKTKKDGMAVEFLGWIKKLSLGLDALKDKEIAKEALWEASRACYPNLVKAIRGFGEIKDLDCLAGIMNKIMLRNETITEKEGGMKKKGDNLLFMSSNTPNSKIGRSGKCSCPMVIHEVIEVTPTHCYCSEGCLKLVFEEVLEKPVAVKTLKGLARGDNACAFEIKVG